MKKLLFVLALTVGVSTTSVFAQDQQRDPAQMAQRMKERVKPDLVSKTKISDTEADKVLDLVIEQRQQMRELRDLSADERASKIKDLNDQLAKKLKAIPLSDEKVKAVQDFLEEQRQQQRQRMQQQQGGGGGR